jgi:DNA-binding beta-propeller fold protein YncE
MRHPRRLVIPALALGVLIGSQMVAGVPAFATLTSTFSGTVDSSGATGPAFKPNVFTVQSTGAITGTLTWTAASGTPGVKLTMFLKDPTGTQVAVQTAGTQGEQISYSAPVTGKFNIGVKAIGGAASYSLVVQHSPSTSPPPAGIASYSTSFGYTGHAGLYAYGMGYDHTDGTVLVADLWNYRVLRYTTGGTLVGTVSHIAARGATGGIGSPFGVAADSSGNVWVADQSNSRVVEFDHNGNWLQSIGAGGGPNASDKYSVGCGNGNTTIPTHIAFDPTSGNLFVSDPRCRNVYIFNPANGSYLGQFTWPKIGTPIPRGLAVDSAGNVYVAEFNTKKIYVFDTSGNYKSTFQPATNPDDMSDVRGLALDSTNGFVYAVGAQNNKVVKFKTNGTYVATWGYSTTTSPPRAFNSIRFVATDPSGNVYVSDVYGYQVWKLDSNGNVLSWATPTQPPPNGGMNQNNGIGIDPATGNLYVVDTFENRVQRFATTGTSHCLSINDCPAYQLSFGHRGPLSSDNSDLDYPHVITVGGGYVWMDSPNAVLQLDSSGNYINRWGTHGKGIGQFSNGPQGMRVIPTSSTTGLIYTTDVGNCRLQIFDYSGNLQSYASTCGSGTGQMNGPRQIDVHGNYAYVADAGNSRIAIWNISTNPPSWVGAITKVSVSGATQNLNQPRGVLVDPTGTWLYIADSNNLRILRVALPTTAPAAVTTAYVVSTGSDTPQTAFGGPEYLEWGPDGRLFVSDNNHTVYAFTINS